MRLYRDGQEFARWPVIAGSTAGVTAWAVQLVSGGTWYAATLQTDPTTLAAADITEAAAVELLVHGPDYTGGSPGTPVTVTCTPRVKATGTTEVVIRQGGRIELVTS